MEGSPSLGKLQTKGDRDSGGEGNASNKITKKKVLRQRKVIRRATYFKFQGKGKKSFCKTGGRKATESKATTERRWFAIE